MKKSKMFKTVLSMTLVMAIALGVTACGTDPEPTPAPEASTMAEATGAATDAAGMAEPEDGDFMVAYIAKNTVDAFHATLNQAAEIALDSLVDGGAIDSWQLFDGMTDPVTQVNVLEDAINLGADMVILLPAEAAGCAPILERCKEENIPCIVVNSKTENTDELATAYIGSDDVQAGEMMAEFVKEQIPAGGGYGHIQGIIGNSAQIDRGVGIHNVMDASPEWALLEGAEQTGEWQAEKAVKFGEDWLAKYGDGLNAIICDNDDMSSAVQTAMNAAGRTDIVCIGVDGNVGPLTMVQSGEMLATVYQDGAAQVTTAVELIPKIIAGEDVPKETMVDFVLVTKDNVDQYLK